MLPGKARILVVPFPTAQPGFGSEPAKLVWPNKSSADLAASGLDLGAWLTDIGDTITGQLVLLTTPNDDPYDLASSDVVLIGTVPAFTLASGIPGTLYKVELQVNTVMGARENFAAYQYIDSDSPITLPPSVILPPSGGVILAVCSGLTSTGNTLADAYLLTCQTSIFNDVPLVGGLPSGCRAPSSNPGVALVIINEVVGGNVLYFYPPDLASSINGMAAGTPVPVPAPLVQGEVSIVTVEYKNSATPFQLVAY